MFNGVQVPYPRTRSALTDREHLQRTPVQNPASAPPPPKHPPPLAPKNTASAENHGHRKRGEAPQKIWNPHPVRVPRWVAKIRRLRLSGEPEQSCGCSGYHQSGTPRYRGRHRYQLQGTSQQSEQQKCTRRACTARTGQPPRRLRYR